MSDFLVTAVAVNPQFIPTLNNWNEVLKFLRTGHVSRAYLWTSVPYCQLQLT
jgi:hypothetical protein